jgi:hypothetical protein
MVVNLRIENVGGLKKAGGLGASNISNSIVVRDCHWRSESKVLMILASKGIGRRMNL